MVNHNIQGQHVQARWIALVLLVCFTVFSGFGSQAAAATAPDDSVLGPAVVQMTGTTINKSLPTGTIPEIDLRLGGGSYPGCLDVTEEPVVDYKTDNMDLTGMTLIATCGWKADETVKVTLMEPSGKFFTTEIKAVPAKNKKNIYEVDITFQPGVDAPEGKYRFTLQGSFTLKTHVFFNKVKGARLYTLPENRFQPKQRAIGGQQRLRLEGFLPNEAVRLLAYQFTGTKMNYYGLQDFKADRNGRLIVETNLAEIGKDTEMNYYAYGQETHSVFLERFAADGLRINRQFDMDLYCPGSSDPRLTGPAAIQPVTGTTSLEIHYQPGFGSKVVYLAPADTQMKTFDYPKCIDHAFWWKVSLSKPILFGWVAESFLGKYLVEAAK